MHHRPAHHAGEKKTLGFSHRLASFHDGPGSPGLWRRAQNDFAILHRVSKRSGEVTAADLTQENTRRIVQTSEWKIEINDVGRGYPIIMLHGTGPGATGWTNFAPNLIPLSQKYRIIALTFPGWGLSDPVEPGTEPQRITNARAVRRVMDQLGIEKAATTPSASRTS
jgi:hypothetical protein